MRPSTVHRRAVLRERAGAVVAREYRDRLTLPELAARLHVAPRSLQRAYAASGEVFEEELRRVRLEAGAELLAEQAIAVADVARLVGFASGSAFARAFRARYGRAPADYRRAARAARHSAADSSHRPRLVNATITVSIQYCERIASRGRR